MKRVAYFQQLAKTAGGSFDTEKIHDLIQRSVYPHNVLQHGGLSLMKLSYLTRHDQEVAELKSQRRPGRPSSTREDLLQQSVKTEYQEYDRGGGFWIPDMQHEGNLKLLRGWNGEWTALNTFKYVRLSKDGTIKDSSFPPKGLS